MRSGGGCDLDSGTEIHRGSRGVLGQIGWSKGSSIPALGLAASLFLALKAGSFGGLIVSIYLALPGCRGSVAEGIRGEDQGNGNIKAWQPSLSWNSLGPEASSPYTTLPPCGLESACNDSTQR
jgi:hypothetical protein